METLTDAQKELYDWLVEYINTTKYAPSIRQMMRAMNLKSPAPIQSRLDKLRAKGYIDWTEGKARTLRLLQPNSVGLRILGAIAAGGIVEPFQDVQEKLDLCALTYQRNCFALRVTGDSMIEDFITEGDFVIMKAVTNQDTVKNGEIVAARLQGYGNTLKRFYRDQQQVTLKASNPKYAPIVIDAHQVEIQGVLIGVWRGYQ